LENDFEVGHYLKERVVPRAVLFFTGEIEEDLSDDDDDYGGDEYEHEAEITEGGDN
jgi:nucleosome assembly protein 1-like 1